MPSSATTLFTKAFSGFSVDDLDAARAFYADTLGLEVDGSGGMGLWISLPGSPDGAGVFAYPKGSAHEPASFTILNFPVTDVAATVAELTTRGVAFEHYEGTPTRTDDDGVFRGGGPEIAWFKDPAGNVLSVVADTGSGD